MEIKHEKEKINHDQKCFLEKVELLNGLDPYETPNKEGTCYPHLLPLRITPDALKIINNNNS